MTNFWHAHKRIGYVAIADADGGEVRVQLCRDNRGRLGVVYEAPAGTPNAGRLTADFGLDSRGFADEHEAERYVQTYPPAGA